MIWKNAGIQDRNTTERRTVAIANPDAYTRKAAFFLSDDELVPDGNDELLVPLGFSSVVPPMYTTARPGPGTSTEHPFVQSSVT
jgi:hypothetical protein